MATKKKSEIVLDDQSTIIEEPQAVEAVEEVVTPEEIIIEEPIVEENKTYFDVGAEIRHRSLNRKGVVLEVVNENERVVKLKAISYTSKLRVNVSELELI